MDEDREASLYLDTDGGGLIGEAIFAGSFVDACKLVWALTPVARTYVRIETADASYDAAQLESMRCEDEGRI
jgi:hypothetical protein